MISDKNKADIINKYFKNELDEETKKLFLEKYAQDESFRIEVDEFKVISNTFQNLSDESAKKIEDFLSKEEQTKESVGTFKLKDYRKSIAIAASIALLIGLSIYLNTNNQVENNSGLANEKVLTIPVYQANNLGYTMNKGQAKDSVQLTIQFNDEFHYYYSYTESMILYLKTGSVLPKTISILQKEDNILLHIDSATYKIHKGFTKPRQLEPHTP